MRAAQDLHALEVVGREQAVEVRSNLRATRVHSLDPVDDQLRAVPFFAADAQRRRLAVAAAIRDADARLRSEQVGQPVVPAQLDCLRVDHGDGRADLAFGYGDQGARHDHFFGQRLRLCVCHECQDDHQ